MKALVFAIALLVSAFAHADVKPDGTFVPWMCSLPQIDTAIAEYGVERVCFGPITGSDHQIVELHLTNGQRYSYSVVFVKRKSREMGVSSATFTGLRYLEPILDPISGILTITNGITSSYQIELETATGLKFEGNLEPIDMTL